MQEVYFRITVHSHFDCLSATYSFVLHKVQSDLETTLSNRQILFEKKITLKKSSNYLFFSFFSYRKFH